ncbi:MAG: dimethylarginine dimethylaminohydrolase family protein [Marinirhabdus sp.]
MVKLHINNEFSRLRTVILGTAHGTGPTPKLEDTYDPKSAQHIRQGTYPTEPDMARELDALAAVFKKYGVTVFRPKIIADYNQVFSRDIAFVIEDKLFKSNILPDREQEYVAICHVLEQIPPENIVAIPEEVHVEGGDVVPHGDHLFVGTYRGSDYPHYVTARTNTQAVAFLQRAFPHKKVKSFNLRKSNTVPEDNALHLDCCFQPIGKGKCILHKNGFLEEGEYQWLVNHFGEENCFHINKREMYLMYSNIFSISENVVVSEKNFTRLNHWLRQQGFVVEEVPYFEISKLEGLLRCSTLPLYRD